MCFIGVDQETRRFAIDRTIDMNVIIHKIERDPRDAARVIIVPCMIRFPNRPAV